MNDASGGTHADTEALEPQRNTGDPDDDMSSAAETFQPGDIDPNAEVIKNIDASVERAGW